MYSILISLYLTIKTYFSERLYGIIDNQNKKIFNLFLSENLPLFIYLPYIKFYNIEYIYTNENKFYFNANKRKINISPVINNIEIFNDITSENITYIDNKYSHNTPFWIILKMENLESYNKILIKKSSILNEIELNINIKDVKNKSFFEIIK